MSNLDIFFAIIGAAGAVAMLADLARAHAWRFTYWREGRQLARAVRRMERRT